MSEVFSTLDIVWQHIVRNHDRDPHGIHGPRHWATVERNGLYLAEFTGASPTLVSLFSLFHDSCRLDDGYDPEHGPRAAEYVFSLRSELSVLVPDDGDFQLLLEACEGHTHITHHENPLIGTCWDADRLDLGRVNVELTQFQ